MYNINMNLYWQVGKVCLNCKPDDVCHFTYLIMLVNEHLEGLLACFAILERGMFMKAE